MSLKMSFWVRPSQKNQNRKSPIYLRLQLDGVRTEYSIGQYVHLSAWDSKGQKVKGLNDESDSINGTLGALKARVFSSIRSRIPIVSISNSCNCCRSSCNSCSCISRRIYRC